MIKIEFSGSGEEVRNEMLRLLGMNEPEVKPVQEKKHKTNSLQSGPVKTRKARRARKEAATSPATWTEEEARRLLSEIKPNAGNIIAELSNKPDGYRRSDLVKVLGLKEQAVRGQLSSVGSALRRMDNKPSPISKVRVDGELIYKLDSVVAGVSKQLHAEN
jgi:hypothetical protein